jgi:hypothetical protein
MFDTQHLMSAKGDTMRGFYEASETLLSVDVPRTLDNLGALDILHTTRFVVATMQVEGNTEWAYALEKPHKFPEYWAPALALYAGRIYDTYGNRIYNGIGSDRWDFEISDNHEFSLIEKDEDEEEVA